MSIPSIVKFVVTAPAIWLIPFVQLKATARMAWQTMYPDRVMPQIMTVREWAQSTGVVAKLPSDIQFDAGLDRLIAESLIPKSVLAKMGTEGIPTAVQRLLDMAYEAAAAAAAIHPSRRVEWANGHAPLFQQGGQFQLEGAIGLIALMWAVTSSFECDVLWQRRAALLESTEHFYVTTGLQQDVLVQAILDGSSHKVTQIDLGAMDAEKSRANQAPLHEYIANDSEDLVQQTAAVILASQTQQGTQSIALIALDRQITRRVSAVLANRGVTLIDETGWALSTTSAAAQLMVWLEAMAGEVASDIVLAALKFAPNQFQPADVSTLERTIRANAQVNWSQTGSELLGGWPQRFARPRKAADWLLITRELMQHVGLWDAMQADEAGQAMLKALHLNVHLDESAAEAPAEAPIQASIAAMASPMPYSAYVAWVRAVLEANRFRLKFNSWQGSEADQHPCTVTILPLAQTWGRHFDAVLVPGCDERRLPARPHQLSDWSTAQRQALQLLTADDAALQQAKAWTWLCSLPSMHLLWQQMDGAEALQKSSLLQILEMDGRLRRQDSALVKAIWHKASQPIEPSLDVFQDGVIINWQALAPTQLSASSYADLRACPYRFYGKNILGLRDSDELDEAVDKRDFGTWLHGTLYRFHEALKHDPALDRDTLLVRCGFAEQKALGLDDAAFLPFALIWPKTRKAYLSWLTEHEASGASYLSGEVEKSFDLDVQGKTVKLFGKLDRIDIEAKHAHSDGGSARWLLDYKTEAIDKTKRRIKAADEDTQLAFYAALVANDDATSDEVDSPIRAAYVNLSEGARERDVRTTNELANVETHREALLDGIWSDLSNMAAGHGLRALGEGEACTYCQVRGLCRRDFR